jgi:hypothetical protein
MTATTAARAPLPTALIVRDDPRDIKALWAMTHEQRVAEMWAGRLTLTQLTAWSSRCPNDIPRIGREFAWIMMRTPEWLGDDEEPVDNVVPFPARSEHRAAA